MLRNLRVLFGCSSLLLCIAHTAAAQNNNTACAPNMRFGSLLDGVQISGQGRLVFGEMIATCLPEPARQSSSNYPYDPDDGGKFSTVVKRASGEALTTYVWYVEKISSLWVMNHYKVVGGEAAIKPLTPGDYVLEFAVEDKPFLRLPFSVATTKNEDIYNPGTIYLLNGAWNDYGAFWYLKPERYTQFLVFLRDTGKPNRQGTPVDLKLIRVKDNKVLATSRPDDAVRLKPSWNLFKLSFNPVSDTGEPAASGEFHASEVLKTDGNYLVRLSLDGKLYGEYQFTVKGGQIQYQGRQLRDPASPLVQIEDVNNSWWIRRR
ncbi:MAG TPA: hypothetical protein VFD58_02280 [Blastocatellia bacterium]|nr:hypothetical protein [Blastocatellia bacterium]